MWQQCSSCSKPVQQCAQVPHRTEKTRQRGTWRARRLAYPPANATHSAIVACRWPLLAGMLAVAAYQRLWMPWLRIPQRALCLHAACYAAGAALDCGALGLVSQLAGCGGAAAAAAGWVCKAVACLGGWRQHALRGRLYAGAGCSMAPCASAHHIGPPHPSTHIGGVPQARLLTVQLAGRLEADRCCVSLLTCPTGVALQISAVQHLHPLRQFVQASRPCEHHV